MPRRSPRLRRRRAVRVLRVARGAGWALWSLVQARYRLRRVGLAARIDPPRWTTEDDGRGLRYVLGRIDATCLERALVLQSWSVAQGHPADVIIGVGSGDQSIMTAHAWLDGVDAADPRYTEIHRMAP